MLLQLRQKEIINKISNVSGTMAAKNILLVMLLSLLALLTAVEAGKYEYTLTTTCVNKYE